MSQFSKLNDRTLKMIMDQIAEVFSEASLDLESTEEFIENIDIVYDICKYFGITEIDFEDLSYLCGMFHLNEDIEPPFRRPTLKKIKVTHKEHYVQYGTRYYEQYIDSYTLLDEDDINKMQTNDMYQYWNGKVVYNDIDESDVSDDEIDDVEWVR